jgi:peptide deformylase
MEKEVVDVNEKEILNNNLTGATGIAGGDIDGTSSEDKTEAISQDPTIMHDYANWKKEDAPTKEMIEKLQEIETEQNTDIEIVCDGNSLHRAGREITLENWEEAYECRKKMIKYMSQNPDALGVAAQQVGYDLKMFVMRKRDNSVEVVVNPEINLIKPKKYGVIPNKYNFYSVEGCLSIPEKIFKIKRCYLIKPRWQDTDMNWKEKRMKNLEAVIFQHEYDHINGILISDSGEDITEKAQTGIQEF